MLSIQEEKTQDLTKNPEQWFPLYLLVYSKFFYLAQNYQLRTSKSYHTIHPFYLKVYIFLHAR